MGSDSHVRSTPGEESTVAEPTNSTRRPVRQARPSRLQVAGTLVQMTAMAVLLFWVIVGARDGLGVVYATLGRVGTLLGSLVAIFSMVVGILLQSWGRSRLSRRLQQSDGRLCPRCHYNLAGLTDEGHCPECGEPYSPDQLAEAWRRALRPPWR